MIRKHVDEVPAVPVERSGFQGMSARYALTRDDGCPRYAMRVMEFAPAGFTSLHAHAEEHEFYFLEGEPAIVDAEGRVTPLRVGDLVYVAPGEAHQLKNVGRTTMKVLCTIPILEGGDGKITHHVGSRDAAY